MVIPVLGRYRTLTAAIDRLERQRVGQTFELLVVSDAADEDPDRTAATVRGRSFPARHLQASTPGAASARELGWREAESHLILFLDSDVLASRVLLAEHLRWHTIHGEDEVGILGRVRWARGITVTAFMRWIERGIQFAYHTIPGESAGWGHFYTANVSVKRAMLEQVGGFDAERFPFHYEDLDLAYRMSREGFRLLYNRRASAEHLHVVTLDQYRRRMAEIAPMERLFVEVHPEVAPYFHQRFVRLQVLPPARGRAARLVKVVPPWLPWVGSRAWRSADHYFGQQLAPDFLAAWDRSGKTSSEERRQPRNRRKTRAESG
ncbi:MAG: glycosyltransferase family 2 protein [Solirubrobacterales bacterium]